MLSPSPHACEEVPREVYHSSNSTVACVIAGEPHHSVKLEAVLEAPIERVLALAVEYDLTKRWNSFMKESAILHAE